MKFFEKIKPLISFRRPRNLADNLVRSKIKDASNTHKDEGMKKYGKSRCHICSYVEEAEEFEYGNKKHWIHYPFDCDSEGVIYVIRCISCSKIYVGSTITTFRKRFNNYKSSMMKYDLYEDKGVEKWLRSICTHIFLALGIKVCVMLGLSLLIKLMLIDQHKGGLFGYTN